MTLIYGVVDLDSGKILLSAVGHPHPWLWNHSLEQFSESTVRGLPVGVLENSCYTPEILEMKPGDRLFIFTDGILEYPNPTRELFGAERFRETLRQAVGLPISQVPQWVNETLQAWRGSTNYPDDISLLILER
ncbi:hypothetical protein CCP3SC1_40011 [Gammaproteobacteria bacterium]